MELQKGGPRQPEPDERDAMSQLVLKSKDATSPLKVHVTGLFTHTDHGYSLEVREFIWINPPDGGTDGKH